MIKRIMDEPKTTSLPTSYDIEWEVESFHWWFAGRKKLLNSILSSIDLPPNCVTLDVGCGAGSNLKILRSLKYHAVGLDRSIYVLSLVLKKLKVPLVQGDLSKLPFRPKSIGLIVAMDILEHLEHDMQGIHQCYETLREGGFFILSVPVFNCLRGIQDIVTGHKRRYSRKEIMNKLRGGGFEILKSSYFNFFLFIPILLGRRIIHILGLKIESENKINFPLLNFFLKTIFLLELCFSKFFSFPFGVSILCIAKKR